MPPMLRVPIEIQIAIEQFLAYEARLLDEHKFDEWLALLADDIKYLMPINESLQQPPDASSKVPEGSFALFDDDKDSLTLRAGRMQSKVAPTEVPAALLQRLITNIQAFSSDAPNQYQVRSNFLVYQERRGRHASTFIGRRDDLLRHTDGAFKITRREIHLAQTLLPATISLFF
jgi:3-phenylpropionate/cinnamic acid dioxygenase small subunit